jgi:hypothetical protein
MKYRNKTASLKVVLRLVVGLTTILFALSLTNVLNAEDITSHKGRFWNWNAEPVEECGQKLKNGHFELREDLDCAGTDKPAIRIKGPVTLNLKGHTLSGNEEKDCIEIDIEDGLGGATVRNGFVTQCGDNGIRVKTDRNRIISVKVSDSADRGIRIDGDYNLVINCRVEYNGTQGIKIDGGNHNKIFSNRVFDSCRDGIEIDGGSGNWVFYNRVENNGNKEVCDSFAKDPDDPNDSYYYKPWFYAGIDVLSGSENNKIKHNLAGCNLGCVPCYDINENPTCKARERDFWDKNVGDNGDCDFKNVWQNNRVVCKNVMPEYSPEPVEPE